MRSGGVGCARVGSDGLERPSISSETPTFDVLERFEGRKGGAGRGIGGGEGVRGGVVAKNKLVACVRVEVGAEVGACSSHESRVEVHCGDEGGRVGGLQGAREGGEGGRSGEG